jgi:hypothetical protein
MGLRYSNMQPLKHENQSNLSGVVTTVSPFPSPRTVTTRKYL